MPEAAIHHHSDALTRESNVDTHPAVRHSDRMVLPEPQAGAVEAGT